MLVDYNSCSQTMSYRPNKVCAINWEEFVSQDKDDIRDGMSPEDYVRNLRDLDRQKVIL